PHRIALYHFVDKFNFVLCDPDYGNFKSALHYFSARGTVFFPAYASFSLNGAAANTNYICLSTR
ncbi:MAG: hypothetical protein ACTIKE_13320, partial [Sphingobacterium sp.]